MAFNPQVERPQSTSSWKQPLAFGLLVCAPLIVGGVRTVASPQPVTKVAASIGNTAFVDNLSIPECEVAPECEPTLFVAAFSEDTLLLAQADKQAEPNASSDEEAAEKKDDTKEAPEKEEEKAEEKEAVKKEAGEKAEPKSKKKTADSPNDEPECCNANTEFSEWSTTLDDDIRKAVTAAITAKLTSATENLDKQQERLERLQVETELYKLQIQHLRNRLKEWDND